MVGEEQEPDNAVNKFAMKVVKNNEKFLVCLVVQVSFMNINEVFEHSKHRLYMDVYSILNLDIMV